MTKEQEVQLNKFLEILAESLDIPDSLFELAKERYESVGDWLCGQNSSLLVHNPEIILQGSFKLGTVVKPISHEDDYDIDLVCELQIAKDLMSQEKLKNIVGERLKESNHYRRMIEEPDGRRCWTINYADSAQFHIDVLPAVPDAESFQILLETRGLQSDWSEYAVAITDKNYPNYSVIDPEWPRSNPLGFAEWFRNRMLKQFEAKRIALMEQRSLESIEDVPEYLIKTTLQRVIQLLKRHRDIAFKDYPEDKPATIIITTLAALAYNNESILTEALINIIDNMHRHIELRDGKFIIQNPVDPLENFADRWNEQPIKKENFSKWLDKVRTDFHEALNKHDIDDLSKLFTPRFGDKAVNEAVSKIAPALSVTVSTPSKVEITNPSKPWSLNDRK